jgi:hypothetical protein
MPALKKIELYIFLLYLKNERMCRTYTTPVKIAAVFILFPLINDHWIRTFSNKKAIEPEEVPGMEVNGKEIKTC